jgi:putative transposase
MRTPPRHPHFDYAGNSSAIFVTFCVWDREPVFGRSQNATVMRETLLDYRQREWYWILCYCVMPDHVHILLKLRTIDRSLSTVITALKNESKKRVHRVGHELRWQYGYYDRILRYGESELEYAHYIMQNPVRAGLTKEGEQYAYSGIVDRF